MKKNREGIPNKKPVGAVENQSPVTGKDKHKNRLGLLLFFFAFLLYFPTVFHDFVLDDEPEIVKNSLVHQGISAIPAILRTDFWAGYTLGVRGPQYRPGSLALFAIEWQLFPDNPHAFHLVNVLLYAVTCWLLFRLLSGLFREKGIMFPFVCVFLYAAHPIHTEVVSNIKSVDEILCFLFALLASHFAVRFAERNAPAMLALSALCYFISMLFKETGIVFLVVIPVILYLITGVKPKQILAAGGALFMMTGVYLLIRWQVLQDVPGFVSSPLINTLYAAPDWLTEKATAAWLLLKYLLLLVFPHPLSFDYGFSQIPIREITDPLVILSILVYLAVIIYALIFLRKNRLVSFGILFYLLTLAPVSNIFLLIGTSFGERLLYMPSLGYSMVLGWAILRIFHAPKGITQPFRAGTFLKTNAGVIATVLIIVGLYSGKTLARSRDWKDNLTLFSHDVRISENSATAHYHFGNSLFTVSYRQENDTARKRVLLEQVIAEYTRAIMLFPGITDAYKSLGDAYSQMGDYSSAIEYLEQYNKLSGGRNAEALKYLGSLYDRTAQYDKAIARYRMVLEVGKEKESIVYYSIGLMYNKNRQYGAALPFLDSCLQIDPRNSGALQNKALALVNLDRNTEALRVCETLAGYQPSSAKAWCYKGYAYINLNNFGMAARSFKRAMELDSSDAESRNGLEYVMRVIGNR